MSCPCSTFLTRSLSSQPDLPPKRPAAPSRWKRPWRDSPATARCTRSARRRRIWPASRRGRTRRAERIRCCCSSDAATGAVVRRDRGVRPRPATHGGHGRTGHRPARPARRAAPGHRRDGQAGAGAGGRRPRPCGSLMACAPSRPGPRPARGVCAARAGPAWAGRAWRSRRPRRRWRRGRGAPLVTRATAPVLTAAMVRPGMHINAVGAIDRSRREFEPAILERATVVTDSVSQARRLSAEVARVLRPGHRSLAAAERAR